MSSTLPCGSRAAWSPAWSTPGTRKSSSECGIPRSSSRTAPPTTYASRPSERTKRRISVGTDGYSPRHRSEVGDCLDLDERACGQLRDLDRRAGWRAAADPGGVDVAH